MFVKGDKSGNFGERVFDPEMGYQVDDDKPKPPTSSPPAHLSQAEAGSLGNACSWLVPCAYSATGLSAETASRGANYCKSVGWTLPTQEELN